MVSSLVLLLAAAQETAIFKAETTLAVVPFHVVRKNRYAGDLKPEDIVLLEDGVPRKITLFQGGGNEQRTLPLDITLLFDMSGSVTHEGLLNFVAYRSTLLEGLGNVRLAIYGFDSKLRRFLAPSRDAGQLDAAFRRALEFRGGAQPRPAVIALELPPKRKADPRGGTWIFEAVLAAAREPSTPGATRMMVVFSDGFATTDTRPADILGALREAGVRVYPVALGHERIAEQVRAANANAYDSRGNMKPSAIERLDRLRAREEEILEFASLGELTGGRSFDPGLMNSAALRQILTAIVATAQFEYVAGFSPSPGEGAPRSHKLEIRLASKSLGKLSGGTRSIVY